MNRDELIRRLRRYARSRGLPLEIDTSRGKGGHAVVRLGDRRSVVPSGQLKRGTLAGIIKQLGLEEGF
ncbi:MAG: type II toxin-antitoxin system HicA family toxin [Geminicoccaceae bacterium]|nr:MAG: type II toxin-antitoxin system HicA family toxin [Geminicoccaceae bacterium]